MKSLELRLELRKAINAVEQTAKRASELLPIAKRSREADLAARGLAASGPMKEWQEQSKQDHATVREFESRVPKPAALEQLKEEQLEAKLAEVHKLQLELNATVDRLDAGIREDGQHRAGLHRAAQNPRGPHGT